MSAWVLWLCIPVFAYWLCCLRRENHLGIGLRFLYVGNLSAQLFFGPLVYWLWDYPEHSWNAVFYGLAGMTAFVAGAYSVTPWLFGARPDRVRAAWAALAASVDLPRHRRLCLWLLAAGLVAQSFLGWSAGRATIRSLVSQTGLLATTGAFLLLLNGIWSGREKRAWQGVAGLVAISVWSALTTGFAGMGAMLTLVAVALVAHARGVTPRGWLQLGAAVLVGMVLYNGWIAGRRALRLAIAANAPVAERVSAFLGGASAIDGTDLAGRDQAWRVRYRVDQSWLFERAIRHTPAREPFARGETLWKAFLAPVPRALWPAKPVVSGGRAFVERFTGIRFLPSVTVSVGMHPILEFYVNFGLLGILLGMLASGVLCGALEYWFLLRGHSSFLVQVTVLQLAWAIHISTVLAELVMTASATLVVAVAVAWAVRDLRRRGVLSPTVGRAAASWPGSALGAPAGAVPGRELAPSGSGLPASGPRP